MRTLQHVLLLIVLLSYDLLAPSNGNSQPAIGVHPAPPPLSGPTEVIVAAPTKISGTATHTTVTLTWQAIPGASGYLVSRGGTSPYKIRTPSPVTKLSNCPSGFQKGSAVERDRFGAPVLTQCATYTDTGLSPGGKYQWKVISIFSDNRRGFSEPFGFSTLAPVNPPMTATVENPLSGPISDAELAGIRNVTLVWTPAPDATGYMLRGPKSPETKVQSTTLKIELTPGTYEYKLVSYYGAEPGMGDEKHPSTLTVTVKRPVFGFADLHTHQFGNLGFGGKAVFGPAYGNIQELVWCTDAHGPGGGFDFIGNSFVPVGKGPRLGHLVGGFPQFDGWPRWDTGTHQTMFEDWLFRAHAGGLQLMVMLAVNNKDLCDMIGRAPNRGCSDEEAVNLQLNAAYAMQDHIDLKALGEPTPANPFLATEQLRRAQNAAKGWYRIVTSPRQARAAIDKGQLAVVLGIEVDDLLDCPATELSWPKNIGSPIKNRKLCTESDVKNRLDALYKRGVRHLFPIHFVDNGFGGTALGHDIFNVLNQVHNGVWYEVENCSKPDAPIEFRLEGITNPAITLFGIDVLRSVTLPSGPHCNARGLTQLGRFLIDEMMRKKMIIDIDHMSQKMANDVLTKAEGIPYPVVSSHTGFIDLTKGNARNESQISGSALERVRKLGGMVSAILKQGKVEDLQNTPLPNDCSNSSKSWASAFVYAAAQMKGGPVGFGSDLNAFFGAPTPRFGPEACQGEGLEQSGRISYPFKVMGREDIDFWNAGKSMSMSVIGEKTFDFNIEGLAHIGMLPDFFEDVKGIVGGNEIALYPLLRSAEGYLRMWERVEATRFH